MTKRTQASVAA